MSSSSRAAMAFTAMKAIGISEKKVKPVLKSLLKLYDKNWALIEDENYRVLADAIFENEELKVDEAKDAEEHADSVPPLRRLRLRNQEEQSSLAGEASHKRPKLEDDNLPQNCPIEENIEPLQACTGGQISEHEPASPQKHLSEINKEFSSPRESSRPESAEATQLHLRDKRAEPQNLSLHTRQRDKGKEPVVSPRDCYRKEREEQPQLCLKIRENRTELNSFEPQAQPRPISPQLVPRKRRLVNGRAPSGVCLIQPKLEPDIDVFPQDTLVRCDQNNTSNSGKITLSTCDLPQVEAPIAAIHPSNEASTRDEGLLHKDSSNGNDPKDKLVDREQAFQSADVGYGINISSQPCDTGKCNEIAKIPEKSGTEVEIASLSSGEVKISLSCNFAHGLPNFHLPSLDEVLKRVEDKCLKSYKIIEPSFSLPKLMEELCQSYLELATDSRNDKQESMGQIKQNLDLSKKSNIECLFGAKEDQGTFHMPANSSNATFNFQCSPQVLVPHVPRPLARNRFDDLFGSGQPNQEALGNSNGEIDKIDEQKHPDPSSMADLSVVLHQDTTPDDIRPLHDVNDITRGEESVRVSLVNEVNSEPYPPLFYYIRKNIIYKKAHVSISLARIGDEDCCSNCYGDCLSSSIPCACARETGGDFAYTLEGLVKEKFLDECISVCRDPQQGCLFYCNDCPVERCKNEDPSEPCKGHLMRKFIKECWSKCGCNKRCGNRVVQRGITCNLQVFFTPEGKGWGLRALEPLPRGTFVCEYAGEILTSREMHERNMQSTKTEQDSYPVLLDADWCSKNVLEDEQALWLDAASYGNIARFINHRCFDASLVEIPIEIETPSRNYYHLAFFTTRNIDALEELTWDYGIDFNIPSHPVKAFRCRCGSKCCRDMKRPHKAKHNQLVLR